MHIVKVLNIPYWISEIHLKDYFIKYGKIIKTQIALDKDTLRSLGYGYVVFADEQGIEEALKKNDNLMLDGASIKIISCEEEEISI